MKIARAEVVPYALPFREPYVTARGTLTQREMALLRLRDEDGLVGLGEAVPLSLRGSTSLATVVAELEALAGREELDEETLRGDAPGLSAPARCAALTALLDLRGRRATAMGEPSDATSAGESSAAADLQPIECNATLIAGEPAAVAADAERWATEGFGTFKLKLGAGDDVGQVRAVRDALGPAAKIRVDANAAWDVQVAARILSQIEPFEIELVEQPAPTLEELAQIGAATSIPVAGDESIESRADAEQAVRLGACDLTGVKLSKVGGPEEAIEIATVMPVYMTSALDGPVGIAAAAQVAQTLDAQRMGGASHLAHGLATQRLFTSTVASVECELRDGMLHLPPGPGLGVEINEDALRMHRL
ncbi:MAG TPA: mandelate racemase/muconate lactonizing enzyme family protein [Solirubrobacterales bacterium]|nr:mandelate racemase/muconate lactonizing enzyme family protein [Solirubrobacterales bacterium]